jgi:lipoprotein-releasing system permease protein
VSFSFFIARRYFLSRRKKNFINIISILSMFGVAMSTAALVIVLSVFNGLGGLLQSLYTAFDPELKIEAVKGKTFEVTPDLLSSIQAIDGVNIVTEVIEDYAYVRYGDAEMAAIIRGVSDNFIEQKRLENHIINGDLRLRDGDVGFAIVGAGVQSTLSISTEDESHAMQIFYIKNAPTTTIDLSRMYSRKSIRPGAVFSIEKNYDENYIFLPLDFAIELLDYGNKRTFLEVKTSNESRTVEVQKKLQSVLGDNFRVLTNEEQHRDLYKLLNMEKLFMFLALSLVTLVGSLNIFFSLMMLALDKKKDISILFALGAYSQLIRRIFLMEGCIIAFIGAGTGLALGALICWAQSTFGLVGMGMENAIVSAYPVEMKGSDFISIGVMITVVTIGLSFYPAVLASRSYSDKEL